ncbi:M14 family zinc carboxypeptidase [Bacillus sp. 2205SS5-2]|uniref:M14 family zinc carboxypeptidase n=1 Tax=Bacillus sp. 2205SS5-2 TaxID=3109031 RepID=UPI003003D0F6
MELENIHSFTSVKQGDTKAIFELKVVDEGTPVDLNDYNPVTVIIANAKGKILELTPTLDVETGVFSFSFSEGDVTGFGDMQLEVHITDTDEKTNIVPNQGYYRFTIEKNLDSIGTTLTSYTLDYFINDVEQKKVELQSIADQAIETANNAESVADQAEDTANNVQTQLDLIVNRETDSDAMSAQAAVDANGVDKFNLKTRLDDDYNVLTEQLAHTASKAEVDSKVAQIVSGSPKGTYTTLSALQTAFPTGTTGVYVVTADGKWYYWNGTAWTAGGTYQSTGISKKSIGTDKVSFIKESSNLFNQNTVTQGIYLDLSGNVVSSPSYSMTDFIPVEVAKAYSVYGFIHFSRFDSNKQFISRSDTGGATATYTHTITSGVAFVKLSFQHGVVLNRQVNEGSTLAAYEKWFTPYIEKVNAATLSEGIVEGKHVKEKEIGFEKTNFINRSTNIFDIKTITRGFNLSSTDGSLVANSAYDTSDFIIVSPSKEYTYYGFLNVAYYDANKQFISRPLLSYSGQTLTTPSNAKYIRVHFQPNNSNKPRQINEGNTLLPYEEFYSTFKNDTGLSGLNILLKKGIIDPPDRFMIDVSVDGTYNTNETFPDYTTFGTISANDVYTMFDNLMSQYPNYITKELLGNDSIGLPIYAYYLTPALPAVDVPTKIPKLFLPCGVHGNEKASTLSTYLLIKQMCEKWNTDPLLEALRFNVKFIIIPVANPSGWNAFTRTNVNGVDINRNFPFEWVQGTSGTSTYGGSAPLSELETQYIKSVFDNHKDINFMYDFHNYHTESNGNYFLWIPTASGSYVQHMAQTLFSRLTRKWKREFAFIPENYFAGYANTKGEGMIQNYAQSIGIKYSATFEICWKWVLDTNSVPYDQNMCKTGVEALANWLLINLKEITK